jgi:hypothetical protein
MNNVWRVMSGLVSVNPRPATQNTTWIAEIVSYWSRRHCSRYRITFHCLRYKPYIIQVHKAFLSRDSSTFEGMFSVPQGDSNVDGGSDQQPITLRGDTVEQFRSLIFIVYALWVDSIPLDFTGS